MDPEDSLRDDLAEEPVGLPGQGVFCDYPHDTRTELDITTPVCYEAIKVVDLAAVENILEPPTGWVLDAVRCQDHASHEIKHPTDGYAEALVSVEVDVLGDTYYVLDADSIELRDYSPGHDGHHPLPMTPQLLQQAAADNDYGAARVERHMPGLEPTGPTMSTAW